MMERTHDVLGDAAFERIGKSERHCLGSGLCILMT